MICKIFGAGSYGIFPTINEDDFILACDGGIHELNKQKIVPDLLIGDFDSSRKPTSQEYPILALPAEKDDTDVGYAAEYAYKMGVRSFEFYGCTGGERFDHTLGNIQIAMGLAEKGCKVAIYSHDGSVLHCLLAGSELTLDDSDGNFRYYSVFAHSNEARVSIESAKYPLTNHLLRNTHPLGISNELTNGKSCVTVHEGLVLVVRN